MHFKVEMYNGVKLVLQYYLLIYFWQFEIFKDIKKFRITYIKNRFINDKSIICLWMAVISHFFTWNWSSFPLNRLRTNTRSLWVLNGVITAFLICSGWNFLLLKLNWRLQKQIFQNLLNQPFSISIQYITVRNFSRLIFHKNFYQVLALYKLDGLWHIFEQIAF